MSFPSSESRPSLRTAGRGSAPENRGAGMGIDESLGEDSPLVVSEASAILLLSLRSRGDGSAEENISDGGSDSEAIVERRELHNDSRPASLIRLASSGDSEDVAHERLAEADLIWGYCKSVRTSLSVEMLA